MKFMPALLVLCFCACVPASADNFLILPFFNLSKESNLEWIGESLAETVREALASEGTIALSRDDRQEAFRRLSVRPQTQLTKATVIRIAEILDAHQVIYGTFDYTAPADGTPKTRGTLRIVAQIINLRKASRGPEYAELGALEDLARLQTHLAWQTLQFVMPESAPSETDFRSSRPVVRVEAIENYTRGILAPTPELKLRLLSQAVRIEPRFSQANFELGRLHWDRKDYRLAADYFLKVTPADVHYRQANFFLGLSRYYLNEFAGAERAFRSVAEVLPLNEVWNNLAAAQLRQNRNEALANFQKALEGDPADPDYHFNVGYALYLSGDLEQAAVRFRAVLDRDPDDAEATTLLGRCLKPAPASRNPVMMRAEALERVKEDFEESAYLQLKAVLEPKR